MGKRIRLDEPQNDSPRFQKRTKYDGADGNASHQDIGTARELSGFFAFEQNEAALLRSLVTLRSFLNSILHPSDPDTVPRQRAILREYLESQQPRQPLTEDSEFLPQLMQTWNFAASANSDKLLSTATSVVDQLLKALSNHIDFRDYGLALCKTVLQQAQLRILSRGMASPRVKEHVIGPCLRILKEVVTFDGGVLARQLYAKRDLAFDPQIIGSCLKNRKQNTEGPEDVLKKPSVRTTTIRYILANFKFQDDGAKTDMIKQGHMMRVLLDGIEGDHPRIIRDVLEGLSRDVIQDTGIPKRNKGFLFNDRNLLSLCQLYRQPPREEEDETRSKRPLMKEIHEFITLACTSPDGGVVRPSGWYPPTSDEESIGKGQASSRSIDIGLAGISWYTKFSKHIPIRNSTLGELILTLRPYAYDLERKLLLSIFEAAPELVAWFHRKMSVNFPFTPKLTATWIGYAATLFESIRLPVPSLYAKMGHLPPPVTIMIESILPASLNQKTLRQCLTNSSQLVRFFAIRLLAASFQKLRDVLAMLQEQTSLHGKLWEEASVKLVDEFCQRCPTLSDFTKLYQELRKSAGEKAMLREATLRVMALFYEIVPQVALNEGYDVSIPLTNALQAVEGIDAEDEDARLQLLELGHLAKIALCSSNLHWWNKPKGLKYSPFVSLLRLLVRGLPGSSTDIRDLIENILKDTGAVQTGSKPSGLDALILSLQQWDMSDAVYEFITNCFDRFNKRPIKYEDDMDALVAESGVWEPAAASTSLIAMTIVEQWPFVKEGAAEIGRWIPTFLILLEANGDELAALVDRDRFVTQEGEKGASEYPSITKEEAAALLEQRAQDSQEGSSDMTNGISKDSTTSQDHDIDLSALLPPPHSENVPALSRYRKKDLDTLLSDNDIQTLILSLSSPHLSIRLQALAALRAIMTTLETSTHQEKDQIYLLLGELVETATTFEDHAIQNKSVSGLASAFAAKSLEVLAEPTSALYIKVNEFLNKGASWHVGSMPSYWMEQVLQHPPGDMDAEGAYWREVIWVLEWLFASLGAEEDYNLVRRNGVMEKIMTLFFHPSLASASGGKGKFVGLLLDDEAMRKEMGLQRKVRPLILRIVVRACMVGGATSLITGAGLLDWLGGVKDLMKVDERAQTVLKQVEKEVLNRADKDKVNEWSGGLLLA